jgi:branched-chain amino acid transport system ATP-binding protein
MSVRENLEIGGYRAAARATRASSIASVCALFPLVRDKLDAPAGSLSGGQQQMVAIGRALMAKPRLLLLDEPSLGLSPLMVQAMFGAIRDVHAAGTAVLLVEQNVVMALDIADRAYLLEEGRIVASGRPGDLRGDPHLRRAYLGVTER